MRSSKVIQKLAETLVRPYEGRQQRVADMPQKRTSQRVTDTSTLQRVAPAIPTSTNPTVPRVVKQAPQTHWRRTLRNIPGTVSLIIPTAAAPTKPTRVPLFDDVEPIEPLQYNISTPKAPTKAPTYSLSSDTLPIVPTYVPPSTAPKQTNPWPLPS